MALSPGCTLGPPAQLFRFTHALAPFPGILILLTHNRGLVDFFFFETQVILTYSQG